MKPKPVVLHVYKDCFPPVEGGIEKHIALLRDLSSAFRPKVLCCSRSWRTIRTVGPTGEAEVRAGEYGRPLSAPLSPRMPELLARLRADLIHLHLPNPTGEISALLGRRRRPLIISYHADIVRQDRLIPLYKPLVRACASRAHKVIVGSAALESSPFLTGVDRSRIVRVPYGVDTDWFDRRAVAPEVVDSLRRRFGGEFVIAVGRLVHYKGFEHLIRAVRESGVRVVIVGEGPMRDALETEARGLPNVHFVGRLSETDLRKYLAAATAFVLPSTNKAESFGIATLEAQSMSLPAIVADVGTGTIESIEPDRSGLVVPPKDESALAAALDALVSGGQLRRSMADCARRRVVERHSAKVQVGRIEEIYAETLAGA